MRPQKYAIKVIAMYMYIVQVAAKPQIHATYNRYMYRIEAASTSDKKFQRVSRNRECEANL